MTRRRRERIAAGLPLSLLSELEQVTKKAFAKEQSALLRRRLSVVRKLRARGMRENYIAKLLGVTPQLLRKQLGGSGGPLGRPPKEDES